LVARDDVPDEMRELSGVNELGSCHRRKNAIPRAKLVDVAMLKVFDLSMRHIAYMTSVKFGGVAPPKPCWGYEHVRSAKARKGKGKGEANRPMPPEERVWYEHHGAVLARAYITAIIQEDLLAAVSPSFPPYLPMPTPRALNPCGDEPILRREHTLLSSRIRGSPPLPKP